MSEIKGHPTIEDLRRAGLKITPGDEYFKSWPKPKRRVSLAKVQKILSKIPGSLSKEVARMREEEG